MKTLFISIIALLFLSCNVQVKEKLDNQKFHSFLTGRIKQQSGTLNLTDFNDLDWDKVCILPPYSTVNTADAVLAVASPSIQNTGIATRDDVNVLAFFYREKFVGCMEINRNIDFASVGEALEGNGRLYDKANCVFEYHKLTDGRYAITTVL